ncbi:anticodon-binding aminoacyl-tRNA synthetase, class 1a, partial [Tanacetum coccineum]
AIKDAIDDLPQPGMLERCVVGGPGFLKFKLSKTWIAESIFMMLERAKKMHMGHLQSAVIGDTLDNVLEYSGVKVRRRFHYGDYLDIEVRVVGLAV